uniref:3-hydroxybenzoate 6-hydroxylase 1 n=1 Tax=Anthurium amnicola TaxID=1678845 RepID=A0A1D1Y5Y5_9ARAE
MGKLSDGRQPLERREEGMAIMTSSTSREEAIVIVGGGICGLATALALHRKNIHSLVLERSDSLRATGAAIAIYTNGWRALDQLGIGDFLRQKAIRLQATHEIFLDDGVEQRISKGKEELRCVKRSDLIETLAENLPPGTVHFGCRLVRVETNRKTFNHVLHLYDGSIIIAKVLIGCDGVNSIIAESLQLREPRLFSTSRTRGYTYYAHGHPFSNDFVRTRKNNTVVGRLPIDNRLVYWFIGRPWLPKDLEVRRDPELLKEATLKAVETFPIETIELVKDTDMTSISLTRLRYRAPWDLLRGLHKGTMTVAGDAMHAMIPFLGQGGSAGLEDAIVLARCMAQELGAGLGCGRDGQLQKQVEAAFGRYVKERRLRLLRLLVQTYLEESVVKTKSAFKKFAFVCLLKALFGDPLGHAQYDCGIL